MSWLLVMLITMNDGSRFTGHKTANSQFECQRTLRRAIAPAGRSDARSVIGTCVPLNGHDVNATINSTIEVLRLLESAK